MPHVLPYPLNRPNLPHCCLPSKPRWIYIDTPFIFSLAKVEEEATDKDNKNCSKDNMCSKVIGLETSSICAP